MNFEALASALSPIVAAVDWRIATPAIIAALSGLIGAWLGARGAVRAQLKKHEVETAYARRALAAALRGELLAYFDIVERREQVKAAETTLVRLQMGEDIPLPSFLSEDDEPLPSLTLANDYRSIGTLGPSIASDVAKLASMIGALRSTLISVARGKYSHLDSAGTIHVLERELELWRETKAFGEAVSRRLARVAGGSK